MTWFDDGGNRPPHEPPAKGDAISSRAAEFEVGDRVVISRGEGTVVQVDRTEFGDLLTVEADIGGVWFRIPEDVVKLR